ncbi:hypothetical protein KJ806_00655 [Patescibacteria group bacterium]|nr:hypothetical protein [Patescibacteria group bacterium]
MMKEKYIKEAFYVSFLLGFNFWVSFVSLFMQEGMYYNFFKADDEEAKLSIESLLSSVLINRMEFQFEKKLDPTL